VPSYGYAAGALTSLALSLGSSQSSSSDPRGINLAAQAAQAVSSLSDFCSRDCG
jgi:hypothetical protein